MQIDVNLETGLTTIVADVETVGNLLAALDLAMLNTANPSRAQTFKQMHKQLRGDSVADDSFARRMHNYWENPR